MASYAAPYHGCHIYLCPASPKIAVVFRVQSYKTVIERRSYVSYIKIVELFDLPVCSFDIANLRTL